MTEVKPSLAEVVSLLKPGAPKSKSSVKFDDIINPVIDSSIAKIGVIKEDDKIFLTIKIDSCEKKYRIDGLEFEDLLKELKNINGFKKPNGENCRREEIRKRIYVVDTCYDRNKAAKLKEALENLKRKLGNNGLFEKLLGLLMAVYAHSDAGSIKDYEEYEWFISLVRAAAKSDNAYLPLCPSGGDAMAVLYYYIVTKCGTENAECIKNSLERDEIQVKPEDVREILKKILGLP